MSGPIPMAEGTSMQDIHPCFPYRVMSGFVVDSIHNECLESCRCTLAVVLPPVVIPPAILSPVIIPPAILSPVLLPPAILPPAVASSSYVSSHNVDSSLAQDYGINHFPRSVSATHIGALCNFSFQHGTDHACRNSTATVRISHSELLQFIIYACNQLKYFSREALLLPTDRVMILLFVWILLLNELCKLLTSFRLVYLPV
jgi:hypothetical protein